MSFQTRKRAVTYATVFYLAVALAMLVMRIIIICQAVDPATGFFSKTPVGANIITNIYGITTILFLIFMLLFGFRFSTKKARKEKPLAPITKESPLTLGTRIAFSRDSLPRIFISAFCGFSLITFSFFALLEADLFLKPVEILIYVLAIFSGLFLLLQYTRALRLYSPLRTVCSLIPVVWSLAHVAHHFLAASRSASGEYHNWQMFSLVLIPLFFYLQALFTTPQRSLYHYNLYYAVGIVGASALLIFCVPPILLSSFWYYSAYTLYTNLYSLMMLGSVSLYMLVFCISSLCGVKKVESAEMLLDEEAMQTAENEKRKADKI